MSNKGGRVDVFIATLIAAGALAEGTLSDAQDRLVAVGCAPGARGWIDTGDAADLIFGLNPVGARAALEGALPGVDVIVQPLEGRVKALLIADMDSTMIGQECIDELADYAGFKPQVAEVTERAMRGELDFADALDARVALLNGLDAGAIDRCLAERVTLTPGARTLVRTMRTRGALTVLVSGGFTAFAEPVGAAVGFDRVIANRLTVAGGKLDGTVAKPIVDASTKERTLREAGVPLEAALAVGDGANDLPMIRAAGLGVAYHAKPIVAAAAAARIDYGDLHALLWAQGIPRGQWVSD
jgi:phosphoserine phosphatase